MHPSEASIRCISLTLHAPYAARTLRTMPDYKRLLVPGGTYFFTVNLADRRSGLLTKHIEHLRAAWKHVAERHSFETVAVAILPDHLHTVWTLPEGDDDFATRWRLIKTRFTSALPEADKGQGRRPGERGVWQRRFWEHAIRDERDLEAHVNYIHWNPVKHGHVADVDEWPYSSWHRFRRETGLSFDPEAWKDMSFGERTA